MQEQTNQVWTRGDGFTISTNKENLDLETIHHFLSKESYWNNDIPLELVRKTIENSSLCFGVYERNATSDSLKQVGFARVVTDFVRFAWLADVFILPDFRGRGLSKWLIHVITMEQPYLKGVRFMLATKDAHGLYSQYGFKPLEEPENILQRQYNFGVVLNEYNISKG